METLLRRIPVWLMAVVAIFAILLLTFGAATGREVLLWPPTIRGANSTQRCPSFADLASGDLKPWRFARSDGSQLSSNFMLTPNGDIQGYNHPNESKWEVVGDELRVYGDTNKTTTTYKQIKCYRVVELVGSGDIPASEDHSHVLTRPLGD